MRNEGSRSLLSWAGLTFSPKVSPNFHFLSGLLEWEQLTDVNQKIDQNTVYEIHVVSISDKTTVNTFNYLDLDGDKKISAEEAESLVKMFMKALSTDMGIDVKHLVSFFMALHDKDGDNFISEVEFLNSVNAHEQVLDALTSRDEL